LLIVVGGGKYGMNAKNGQKSAIWVMLFSYLAISKIIYYFDITVSAFFQGGLLAMGEALFIRLITQDLLIILIILLTFNTEEFVSSRISKFSKTVNQVIVHVIDYVLYIGVLFAYFLMMNFFGLFNNANWRDNFIGFSALYLVIVAIVEIKKYLKKEEITRYTPVLSKDEKLVMLKTLRDNNVLTQEEYLRLGSGDCGSSPQ